MVRVPDTKSEYSCRGKTKLCIQSFITSQVRSKTVVYVSTPRMYPRSGYFLVPPKNTLICQKNIPTQNLGFSPSMHAGTQWILALPLLPSSEKAVEWSLKRFPHAKDRNVVRQKHMYILIYWKWKLFRCSIHYCGSFSTMKWVLLRKWEQSSS